MPKPAFATHEVFNQSPPFEDVDLYTTDLPLRQAVAAFGNVVENELSDFGRHWGSAAMAARGRIANENTPKLRLFDSRGNRRDEVEFHPAYHELMAHSAHAGLHNSTWTRDGKPVGDSAEVLRAAKFYMASQVETGHLTVDPHQKISHADSLRPRTACRCHVPAGHPSGHDQPGDVFCPLSGQDFPVGRFTG